MATRTVANGGGNWGTTSTWVEGVVPTSADDVVFTATSGQLTVNVASSCKSINFTNYTNTITFNTNITVSGNITLVTGVTYAGAITNGFVVNATSSITSNGVVFNHYFQTITTSSTITFVDNFYASRVLIGIATVLNGSTLYIGENFTINGNTSGTTNIILNGTGTLGGNSTLRNNLTINTSGTITLTTTFNYNTGTITYTAGTVVTTNNTLNIVQSSSTTTLNTNGMTWNNITFNSTSMVINLTSDLNFSGTLYGGFQYSVTGTGRLSPTTAATINMYILTYDPTMLKTPITIKDLLFRSATINNLTINVSRNITAGVESTLNGSNSNVNMVGTGTISTSGTSGTTIKGPNLTFNTSGTVTLQSGQTLNFYSGTLTYTSGTVVTTGSTLGYNTGSGVTSVTYNTDGIVWDNISIVAQVTITNNSLLTATGQSTFGQAAIGWTGSNGFRLSKLDITATNSSAIYTLKPGLTYTVVDQFTANTNVSGEQHPIFKSGTPGTKANLKFDKYSGTCYLGYIDFTDIDASGGRTITTFSGSLSNTTNIKSFTDSQVVGF